MRAARRWLACQCLGRSFGLVSSLVPISLWRFASGIAVQVEC